jgi:hypothetical protein
MQKETKELPGIKKKRDFNPPLSYADNMLKNYLTIGFAAFAKLLLYFLIHLL